MHPNQQLIQNFYEAFARKDYKAMAACYHPEATFKDEVFSLKGKEIAAMWHLLCERGADLELSFSGIEADDNTGKANWEAWYHFSQSGKRVHNVIQSAFTFKDGKILTQRDTFNFYSWMSQALGWMGRLFGWTGFLQNKVKERASENIKRFIRKHTQYQE
ncbi:Ketosteroid isomerase-related protein [Pseudarcicella hirudinis]|uniref:Ketosteroid isomerase-related protein n=1 Tax=Pseudarcicella hirudinis TaxID=1079859 RepID=A0A1I5NUR0_9BACT|nr:nuclear transport factor 2 family protein [Pseudarcicella hirudinis]SFP25056.1 Ketosteroid isomerase-related protein [Pseudarcicella hirudinis]